MLNYIKAEMYKVTHRKYTYGMVIFCSLFMILCNVIFKRVCIMTGKQLAAADMICYSIDGFSTVYLFTLIIADIIFSDEYKHHTMKNAVSMGIERYEVYFGKLIAEIITAIVFYVVIMGVLVISSVLILGADIGVNGFSIGQAVGLLLSKSLAAFPIWIAGISLANFLAFFFKNNTVFAFAFAGLLVLPSKLIQLISIFKPWVANLNKLLPSYYLSAITKSGDMSTSLIANSYIAGIIYLAVLTLAGILIFQKREIK